MDDCSIIYHRSTRNEESIGISGYFILVIIEKKNLRVNNFPQKV